MKKKFQLKNRKLVIKINEPKMLVIKKIKKMKKNKQQLKNEKQLTI